MTKLRQRLRSPAALAVLLLVTSALLVMGGIGTARAALTYYSETYSGRVRMYDIGVTLTENGEAVSWRDYDSRADGTWNEHIIGELLANLVPAGESFRPGKVYSEVLGVTNSGTIDEYVRVNVYRYWEDADGNKLRDLDPGWIDVHFVTDTGWILDDNNTTDERTTLYYSKILPAGESTPPFADTLCISPDILWEKTTSESVEYRDGQSYRVTTGEYAYNGARFVLDVEVDAVQTHNSEDAILSAWGIDASRFGME